MFAFIKRSWVWLLGVLLIVGFFVLALVPQKQVSPFYIKYCRVRPGMTQKEVVSILGPPHDEFHPGMSLGDHIYFWDDGEEHITITCDMAGVVYKREFEPEPEGWNLNTAIDKAQSLVGR